jgi:hypothetical protein
LQAALEHIAARLGALPHFAMIETFAPRGGSLYSFVLLGELRSWCLSPIYAHCSASSCLIIGRKGFGFGHESFGASGASGSESAVGFGVAGEKFFGALGVDAGKSEVDFDVGEGSLGLVGAGVLAGAGWSYTAEQELVSPRLRGDGHVDGATP